MPGIGLGDTMSPLTQPVTKEDLRELREILMDRMDQIGDSLKGSMGDIGRRVSVLENRPVGNGNGNGNGGSKNSGVVRNLTYWDALLLIGAITGTIKVCQFLGIIK